MSTHTQILYQIVFSTKYRSKCMLKQNRSKVFAYISGIIKNYNCHPYIVNGVEDHLHILTHLHPTVPLASLIKDIKISSHSYIDYHGLFPEFQNWQNGYGAFTYSRDAFPNLMSYIENQEVHHHGTTFEEEYIALLEEHEVEYDPQYIFD